MTVSLVTPCFNGARYLQSSIDSVVFQCYKELEYIIVDGASSDNSHAILQANQRYVDQLIIEPDQGHWDAIGKGFARSSGEIMGWLNCDDMLTPWSLRTVAEIFRQFPDVQWIQGLPAIWNPAGQMVEVHYKTKSRFDYLSHHYGWIQQESCFWRRSLWEKAGGFVSDQYRFMVDGELWSRFFDHAPLVRVDCVLAGFRQHHTNRSLTSGDTPRQEMQQIITAMRARASAHDLRIARAMLWARRLSQLWPWGQLGASPTVYAQLCRLLLGRDYARVCYPVIRWDHQASAWRLLSEPPA